MPFIHSPEQRLALIQKHSNDPNAYALVQPDIKYYDTDYGFVGYRISLGKPVVLGDPLAPADKMSDLLAAFMSKFERPVFSNITEGFGTVLHNLNQGFRFCPFGTELIVPINVEEISKEKKVKGALKKGKKAELRLERINFDELGEAELTLLQELNTNYLEQTNAGKEVTFISRGVQFVNQPQVRFYALSCMEKGERNTFGFMVADPFYENGKHVGYQLNAVRFRRTKIWGVYFSIICLLAEQLAEEGFTHISLGGLAYDELDKPSTFPHDAKMQRRLTQLQKHSDKYYNTTHFTAMKLQFEGHKIRRYMAIYEEASVTRSVFRFLRVSRMV